MELRTFIENYDPSKVQIEVRKHETFELTFEDDNQERATPVLPES